MKTYLIPSVDIIAIGTCLPVLTGSGEPTNPVITFDPAGTNGQGGGVITPY